MTLTVIIMIIVGIVLVYASIKDKSPIDIVRNVVGGG